MDYNADSIRKIMPGFIGGKAIAKEGTDGEVELLAELADRYVRLKNELNAIEAQQDQIKAGIKERILQG